MLRCAMCDKPLRECCDIFETAYDAETGEEVVLCGECVAQLEAEGNGDVNATDFVDIEFAKKENDSMKCEKCGAELSTGLVNFTITDKQFEKMREYIDDAQRLSQKFVDGDGGVDIEHYEECMKLLHERSREIGWMLDDIEREQSL